ncbi:unnamed protein product [Cyclocybe aegerita]|uniref:F-box domain-containing protein n=1 Tax=Cyclocybe aegerita TaxID=1973307 RepID=A0A8S0W2Y5_CYCAE|nr:unnamed protein product [Cyclocybe aegerita]
MSWALDVTNTVIRAAFNLYFRQKKGKPIFKLSADTFVDDIFPYLLIDELLSLRKTCKVFYLLTHEPIIWKRYMRRLRVPLAQLRPTFKFTERISNHEIEFLVTRACAVERSWRRGIPRIKGRRILASQYKIIDLKLVPGGKFLVASAKDKCNYRFYILVYALDVMYGSRLLARLPTFFKVYDIQAQYMDYKGVPGMMISYVRRRFENGAPPYIDVSDYGHTTPIDTHHPLIYDACCIHMRLDAVEELIRPDLNPHGAKENYLAAAYTLEAPFRDVFRHELPAEIHSASLFSVDNQPHMGFAVRNQSVALVELNTGRKVTFCFEDVPGFEGRPHRIRALRFLPSQNDILVIRSISTIPGTPETHAFEIYSVPGQPGYHRVRPKYAWECEDKWGLNTEFTISDPANFARKTGPDHPDILRREYCPPTIWVFAPSENPKGATYWYFRPEPEVEWRNGPNDKFIYKSISLRPYHHSNRNYFERALPGAERTLFYEYDKDGTDAPPIVGFRRFLFPEKRFGTLYPTDDIIEPVMAVEKDDRDCDFAFRYIERCGNLVDDVNKDGGLAAITWDENSGRICLASDGNQRIYVYDLAPVLEPHHRLAYQWRTSLIDPKPEIAAYLLGQ